jgi:hypothetical protein
MSNSFLKLLVGFELEGFWFVGFFLGCWDALRALGFLLFFLLFFFCFVPFIFPVYLGILSYTY